MPKVKRSQADRELIREKILDEALTLISEHGFTSFSMRKLASRLGLTATTIYNYYSNKDELYLVILTRGFEMLYQRFEAILLPPGDPSKKFKELIRAYIDFGTNKAHYYNIMFTSDAPKYRDYIGTDIEPVAYIEKQTALKLIDITSNTLRDFITPKGIISDREIKYFVIKLWSTLHGIIALYNSRVLPEVDENPEEIIEHVADDLIRPLLSLISTKANEKPAGLNTAV